jgi:hypothetical protein
MDEIAQQILAVLDRPTGIGIFSKTVDVPGKGRTRYWFSMASGMTSLQAKVEYRTRFETMPDWVSLCHPDHQIWLCRLAIRGNRGLPPARPIPAATGTGGATP